MGIFQERVLEWVAHPFSSRCFRHRNWIRVSCTAGGIFTSWPTRAAPCGTQHTDWFEDTEKSWHPCGKAYLILVCDPFNVLLTSVCLYFCWGFFAYSLLRVFFFFFVYMFVSDTGLWFSLFCVWSLCLILVSGWQWPHKFGSVASLVFFGVVSEGWVFSPPNVWKNLPVKPSVHSSLLVVSDPSRPDGLQPTRLLSAWDFTDKNTGVGGHFLLVLDFLVFGHIYI